MTHAIRQLETKVLEWAQAREDIRVVLLIGSRARHERPADDLSDVDLLVFSDDWRQYFEDQRWIHEFGTVWVCKDNFRANGFPELMIVYEGGHKLDAVFLPMEKLFGLSHEPLFFSVVQRAVRVLVDKDDATRNIMPHVQHPPAYDAPSRAEFEELCRDFWYEAQNVAKLIRRRELWMVQARDMAMKGLLLRMMEWQARQRGRDTWHEGRFIADWSDPQVYNRLRNAFPRFDAGDSWQALFLTLELFRDVAQSLAEALAYEYPAEMDATLSRYIQRLCARH